MRHKSHIFRQKCQTHFFKPQVRNRLPFLNSFRLNGGRGGGRGRQSKNKNLKIKKITFDSKLFEDDCVLFKNEPSCSIVDVRRLRCCWCIRNRLKARLSVIWIVKTHQPRALFAIRSNNQYFIRLLIRWPALPRIWNASVSVVVNAAINIFNRTFYTFFDLLMWRESGA